MWRAPTLCGLLAVAGCDGAVDGGSLSWTRDVELDVDPATNACFTLAIDPADGFHILYQRADTELRYAHRTASGPWSDEVVPDFAFDDRSSCFLEAEVDADGAVFVATTVGVTAASRYLVRRPDGTWTSAVGRPEAHTFALALDASGAVHVEYSEQYRSYQATTTAAAEDWPDATLVYGGLATSSAIAIGGTRLHALLQLQLGSQDRSAIRYLHGETGGDMIEDEFVEGLYSADADRRFAIAADPVGGVYALYEDAYYRRAAGEDWSSHEIASGPLELQRRAIVASPDGGAHYAFTSNLRLSYGFVSDSADVRESFDHTSASGGASIAIDANGAPSILYRDGTELRLVTRSAAP